MCLWNWSWLWALFQLWTASHLQPPEACCWHLVLSCSAVPRQKDKLENTLGLTIINTSVERQWLSPAVLKQLFLTWVRRRMGGLRRGCSDRHGLTRTVPPCPRVMLSLPSLTVTLSKNITSFRRRSTNFPVTLIAFLSISIKVYSHRSVTVKISPEIPMTVGPVTVQIGSKTQLVEAGRDGESNIVRIVNVRMAASLEGVSTTRTTGRTRVSPFKAF